jgi:hypothetical protein
MAPGGTLDITELILDDHREQRRLFAILEQIDRADTGVLSAIWDRLASFLELHAAAEEAIFYPVLLQVGLAAHRAAGVECETLDAIGDHNEIRDAVAEVARHQVGTDEWFGAVAAANLANSDHMAEEEREGLSAGWRACSAAISSRSPSPPTRRGTSPGFPPRTRTRPRMCARRRKRGRSPGADPSASAASSGADRPGNDHRPDWRAVARTFFASETPVRPTLIQQVSYEPSESCGTLGTLVREAEGGASLVRGNGNHDNATSSWS